MNAAVVVASMSRLACWGVLAGAIPASILAGNAPARTEPCPAAAVAPHAFMIVVDDAVARAAVATSPSIGELEPHRGALQTPHDLRQARPPKQRSERPTSGTHLLGSTLVHRLLGMLDDTGGRRFPPPASITTPLAGHPSPLLRPPAARS